MGPIGESSDLLRCSFCHKSQRQVAKLIGGDGAFICDECVYVCVEIIEQERNAADPEPPPERP